MARVYAGVNEALGQTWYDYGVSQETFPNARRPLNLHVFIPRKLSDRLELTRPV